MQPGFDLADLAFDLVSDGVAHVFDRVDVLDLGLGVEVGRANRADGDVGVTAQVALLHVGLGDAQPAQQLAQANQVLGGLIGATQVRSGDHFHQRYAAAVEVDVAASVGVLGLAGVLFQMQLVDGDTADVRLAAAGGGHGQVQIAAVGQGLVELRNLVALGQVGVEVIFAVEERQFPHLGAHGGGQQHGLFHGCFVQHRQHPRQARADRADVGVRGIVPGVGLAGAEDLGGCVQLDVSLQPDNGFILNRFAHRFARGTVMFWLSRCSTFSPVSSR